MSNTFDCHMVYVQQTELTSISGINFSGAMFVRLRIDGDDILSDRRFDGMVVSYNELKKSSLTSGSFLIFTSVCGSADDVGMDFVRVHHDERMVRWAFEIDDKEEIFSFEMSEYLSAVQRMEKEIALNIDNYVLEPRNVIYPE